MLNVKKLFPFKTILFSIAAFAFVPNSIYGQSSKKINTIIIDPGHGGKDNGAHGEYEGTLGSKEKDINLAISLKLVAELRKQMPGVKIIPTRTTDVYHSVHEKAKFANEHNGDVFVCIHADAVKLKTGSRMVTRNGKRVKQYYKIPTKRKGTSTLILAAHKRGDKIEALEKGDMEFEIADNDSSVNIDYESPEWKARAFLYSQNYFKRSYHLASAVQEEIAKTGRNDLGVWQRKIGLWVLSATQMPAILIETGFVANYDDERYLNSEKGQQEIAEAITRALIKYKKMVESPNGLASGMEIKNPK